MGVRFSRPREEGQRGGEACMSAFLHIGVFSIVRSRERGVSVFGYSGGGRLLSWRFHIRYAPSSCEATDP